MLITTEEDADIAATLAAEDAAIAAAQSPEQAPAALASLVEILNDGPAPHPLPETLDGREGQDHRAR
jgi:hypothetical protein